MADFTNLKDNIKSKIKSNGKQDITGAVLQEQMIDIVDQMNETFTGELTELESKLGYYETNAEYARAYTDAEGKFLWGIKRDGSIEFAKGVPTPIKNYIDSLDRNNDEELERINQLVIDALADVKVLTDTCHYVPNPEWAYTIVDSEGKVLEGIGNDGKTYFPKQEMLEKYNDVEDRTEMTLDADGKILSYRDKEGIKHEKKQHTEDASFGKMNLTERNGMEMAAILDKVGYKTINPSNYSNSEFIEIPIPRVCATIVMRCKKMPTSKTADIEAQMIYNDKDGNYFEKPIILNSQGSSSLGMVRPDGQCGNLSLDLTDGSKIKFGDWVSQDSFHIKKYWIDIFRGQCVVGYHLIEQMYKNRGCYPYDYMNYNDSITEANGSVREDFWTGAQCHPDGFPVIVYWDNGEQIKCFGIYSFNTKKHRDVYYMKKNKSSNIILDGALGTDTFWGRSIKWEQFEVRNPKDLICIDGSEYDGDNPKELTGDSNIDENTALVKEAINRLSNSVTILQENKTKEEFEKYFLVEPFIDYFLQSQVVANVDGFRKNWIWCTWDGKLWTPTVYDQDSIFGTHWTGTFVDKSYTSTIFGLDSIKTPSRILNDLYSEELKARYKELRDSGIFGVENIYGLLISWLSRIGYDNIDNEVNQYQEIVSYRDNQIANSWEFLYYAETESNNYSNSTEYGVGDTVVYNKYKFKSTIVQQGIPPLKKLYEYLPAPMGYYNSPLRVKNWLERRIQYLDNIYSYNINI